MMIFSVSGTIYFVFAVTCGHSNLIRIVKEVYLKVWKFQNHLRAVFHKSDVYFGVKKSTTYFYKFLEKLLESLTLLRTELFEEHQVLKFVAKLNCLLLLVS